MLTSKKRAFLKKEAHSLDAIIRVGKEGYSENLIQTIVEAIGPRELMKIKILQNCEEDKKEMAFKIAENSGCELVGVIGRTLTLYKENKDKPVISLELKKIK
ncbi:MAG: ribosome assembly RNA-binding protein YhbY [Fusobacteriaceae bacterium]